MITLEDIAPSREESAAVTHAAEKIGVKSGLPEQVAIGYILARRKANGGKRETGEQGLGDLFGKFFGQQ